MNNIDRQENVFARWWVSDNWGDALNPILIHHLSGKTPIWCDYPKYIKLINSFFSKWEVIERQQDFFNPKVLNLLSLVDRVQNQINSIPNKLSRSNPKNASPSKEIYIVVGSILHQVDKNAVVWGAGFISEKSRLREKPKSICAVRGPLTREIILKQGLDCPEIYGDPALLYPKFYNPPKEKHYKLGIVPHFADQSSYLLDRFRGNEEVLLINVNGGINKFINDICSCDRIASSSLHGIIAADAYGVPATWINFSDKVIGNGFKFRDYFSSVGRKNNVPLAITENTSLQEIFESFQEYKIEIDLDELLSVCPFREESIQY